jgi:hypothetical protein
MTVAALPFASTPSLLGESPSVDLVHIAALLARLGAGARAAADDIRDLVAHAANPGRTCIDAGDQLLLSLVAPGDRSLRVLARCGTRSQGVMCWRRFYARPGAPAETWSSETYSGDADPGWLRALDLAKRNGTTETILRWQAVLGARGRIYSTNWRAAGECLHFTVSWQLHRGFPPQDALRALGLPDVWPAALPVFQELLGFAPGPRSAPWSVSLGLAPGALQVRLGTTLWALQPEATEKRRRLVALVGRLGGDPRFAEAVYKLAESACPSARRRALGRAVEVEVAPGEAPRAEFYVCLPQAL